MNISSNVSSLLANNTFANNSANNIANANTDNFIPTDTRIVGAENGNVKAESVKADNQNVNSSSVTQDSAATPSQTNLATELTDQVQIEAINEANINTIKTQNEMTGSLLDIKV